MARKVRGFERVLDAPALFTVAYDEIGSSIYFALGIVAAQALGLTPVVLLATGLLFLVVSLSYAEGTAAIPETGGAATFTRRAYNDLVGFATGWVLLLDYLIVISLSTLFLPHYLAAALSAPSLADSPWDVLIAVAAIAGDHRRAARPPHAHPPCRTRPRAARPRRAAARRRARVRVRLLAGGADERLRPRARPGMARRPLRAPARDARLHRARDGREPRRGDARAGHDAAALALLLDRPRRDHDGADRRRRRVRLPGRRRHDRARATSGCRRRSSASSTAFEGHLSAGVVDMLRILVGLSGAVVLFAAATTAITGCTRLARSMAEHGMLPREFGRLERRSLVSRESLIAIGVLAVAVVVGTGTLADDDAAFLASTYSFGVLFAFTAAQLAVIRLRRREPDLARPFRARPEVRIRGVLVPVPALIGAPLTLRRLGARADHASRRAVRGADLAARRARCLRGRAARARGGRVRRHRPGRAAAARGCRSTRSSCR